MRFTHLQVHSHFTLLGSTASVADLAARAAAEGMNHLALTDTNALYGAVAFDRACRVVGVKPILGMTVTVAPPARQMAPATFSGRLVLLAMNQTGYRSLCRLSSQIQGQPQREALARQGLTWEELEAHREGLLCLSGGRAGWVEHLVRADDREAASRYIDRLADVYGRDVYLSVELHQPQDVAAIEEIIALGQRRGLAAVAAQPVYSLSPHETSRLRLLAAIDRNVPLEAVPRSALPALGDPRVALHWLHRDEVEGRFASFPRALASVDEIVARCGQALPSGEPIWPDLKLRHGRVTMREQTPDEALAELAREGMEIKYGPEALPVGRERLERELAAIAGYGYAPLFLVVADIVRFARRSAVPVNTRGSVANSLVAYCAGITNVDPIAHGLYFERFLNPARADLPDIDLDFCSRRRDRVLEYVRRTYGSDQVALVSTVSTLQPRGAVRETSKAYGLDETQTKHLIALLPRGWRRMPGTGARHREGIEEVLAALEPPHLREIIQAAYDLVGQPHHLSVHPGGVVITPGPLTDVVPVQWAPKGFLITQFSHGDVEAIGLPKIDLLGIRALTVLAEAERLTQHDHDPTFSLSDIPLDDPLTAQMLTHGETIGVFQCESAGAQRTLRQLQAQTVQDLSVANAFFKPGPATGGMARTFVRRYRGEEPVAFLHPALAPILESTQGVLLFQEQVLRIAREIAGLEWEQADQLRRGMSHFGHEEMAEIQAHFVQGCQRSPPQGPGFDARQAGTLWEQVLAFAGYGFNQGHATSYAMVSYRSAYLKAHWPAAFLCARLAERGGFHHPAIYIAEATRLGLTVRPPNVNHSDRHFALSWEGDQGVLWMGLGQVRDLRRASVRSIVAERLRQPFSSLRDLLERIPLLQKEAAHLIKCGAMDGLGDSRAALLAEAEQVEQAGSTRQMVFSFAKPRIAPESPARRLAWEQHLLGLPVSVHPLDLVGAQLRDCTPLRQLPAVNLPRQRVTTAGVRLPGWTGGQGFFLGDGETFVTVRGEPDQQAPPPWRPLLVRGRWLGDEWGTFWLQAEGIEPIELS